MYFLALTILTFQSPAPLRSPDFSDLHPALRIDSDTAEAIFEKGLANAQSSRDNSQVMQRFRKGIGGVTKNAFGTKDTVSFLWAYTYDAYAFNWGFQSRKKYFAKDKITNIRENIRYGAPKADHFLVAGHLTLLPSRRGFYGQLSRMANPKDLEDVRVVMKVGDEIYEPDHQPGYALTQSGSGTNEFSTPQHQQTQSNATVNTPNGTASVNVTSTTTYTITHAQNFQWYAGDFTMQFSYFNKDNTPRIHPSDKEVTFIVIYGANERKAVYRLEDFTFLRK